MASGSGQRADKQAAGGMRIDDHSAFMGKGGGDSVLPKGVHIKTYSSAEGAGSEMDYEDTSEKIKAQQVAGVAKAKAHPMKPLYRN